MGKKISSYKDADGNMGFHFHCPACGHAHGVFTSGNEKQVPIWKWNGDEEKPTFSPSINCINKQLNTKCHSFVENGNIRFLSDCTHNMKGTTVELPDF